MTDGESPHESEAPTLVGPATPKVESEGVGQRLGPYMIEAKLGEGGMGVVYRGRHESLGRLAAIKKLPSRDSDLRARLQREAKALAALEHSNIVGLFEVIDDGDNFALAMAYVPGGTLGQKLRISGPLPEAEVLEIGKQVSRGLWAAALAGIVHRDIKPDNLLIGEHGIKISDFGLVNAFQEASQALTRSGGFLGTPAYAPPEQWSEAGQCDHRSDLYSLGCTLFALLTGRPPFPGPDIQRYLKQHIMDPAPDLREIRPEVSDELANIIARLLEKDPADRFQTGEALAEALEAVQRGRPLEMPQKSSPRRDGFGAVLANLVGLIVIPFWVYQFTDVRSRGNPGFVESLVNTNLVIVGFYLLFAFGERLRAGRVRWAAWPTTLAVTLLAGGFLVSQRFFGLKEGMPAVPLFGLGGWLALYQVLRLAAPLLPILAKRNRAGSLAGSLVPPILASLASMLVLAYGPQGKGLFFGGLDIASFACRAVSYATLGGAALAIIAVAIESLVRPARLFNVWGTAGWMAGVAGTALAGVLIGNSSRVSPALIVLGWFIAIHAVIGFSVFAGRLAREFPLPPPLAARKGS
jgi:predicted Ser/Thr protein kinase